MVEIDWVAQLTNQLDWLWRVQLRPRLDGLTDDEYFWEPVPGCWSIRPRGQAAAPLALGQGAFLMDGEWPEPEPAPVTTIAWRLGHVIVGCFAERTAWHFGGPDADIKTFEYAGTAAEALAQLDDAHDRWIAGVEALGPDGLHRPCGPAEGPFADHPLAELILHINREVIHHGAEIALLRDLYLRQGS